MQSILSIALPGVALALFAIAAAPDRTSLTPGAGASCKRTGVDGGRASQCDGLLG